MSEQSEAEDLKNQIKELKRELLIANISNSKMKKLHNDLVNDNREVKYHNVIPLVNPHAGPSTFSYTPIQIQTAYSLNSIVTPNSSLRGTGIKVAVIIAYHYANLQRDFNTFCTLYNLPSSTLTIINQAGKSTNAGWAQEECLDVQMIKLAAPGATIIVVEAANASFTALNTAIRAAVTAGADIVSMSWGSSEFSTQLSNDSVFSNTNVCYVASSGDTGSQVEYPSSSANVLAIGGTSLFLDGSNLRINETIWSPVNGAGGGGGISLYTPKPTYQNNFNSSFNKIGVPHISCVADPSTGVKVVYNNIVYTFGGTSVSCPFFAGFLATVNQIRVANNKTKLTTVASSTSNNVQNMLYNNIYPNNKPAIYDVTNGNNGILQASTGYDIISGVGSFNGNLLCTALASI